MQAIARLEPLESGNQRTARRRKLHLGSALSLTGDRVVIHDLSREGILIETSAKLCKSDLLQVDLPEFGAANARVVWSSGNFFGCEFHGRIPKMAVSAALLRSPSVISEPETVGADQAHDSTDEDEFADDRLPFGVRLRVILAMSLGLWGLILWSFAFL
jgi:hypothetical protein